MYSAIELFVLLTILSLCTFSISSIWLYSPGLEKLKNWWISKTILLAPLGYCQLCCSFWIALIVMPFVFYDIGIVNYILFALLASGVSWTLGAVTTKLLWEKAVMEKVVTDAKL